MYETISMHIYFGLKTHIHIKRTLLCLKRKKSTCINKHEVSVACTCYYQLSHVNVPLQLITW